MSEPTKNNLKFDVEVRTNPLVMEFVPKNIDEPRVVVEGSKQNLSAISQMFEKEDPPIKLVVIGDGETSLSQRLLIWDSKPPPPPREKTEARFLFGSSVDEPGKGAVDTSTIKNTTQIPGMSKGEIQTKLRELCEEDLSYADFEERKTKLRTKLQELRKEDLSQADVKELKDEIQTKLRELHEEELTGRVKITEFGLGSGKLKPPAIQEIDESQCFSDEETPDLSDMPSLVTTDDEYLSSEEFEDSEEAEPVKKEPLVFLLSRDQTRVQVENAIIHGVETLVEKRHLIDGVRVFIQGFEHTSVHPAQIKAAKSTYAQAIDYGLVGFLMTNGFIDRAQEVYCIAYAQAQMRSNGQLKFKKINGKHMGDVGRRSGQRTLTFSTGQEPPTRHSPNSRF